MGQEIVKTHAANGANTGLVTVTLLNIWETCLHRDELKTAEFYRSSILPLLDNETKLYERNLYLFLQGLHRFKSGERERGKEEMTRAIQIYEWLGCRHLARNYRDELPKYAT